MLSITADKILVPLASNDDAATTAAALSNAIDAEGRIVLLHVVEKAGGGIDKASVEQREDRAEEIFEVARTHLAGGDRTVETEIRYGTDIADTITAAAEELDADLIAFSPREAGRLTRLLTGDTSLDLLTDATVPLVVLPDAPE